MFTGIIEAIGKVTRVQFPQIEIEAPSEWKQINVGCSVAVDGVCLTVVKKKDTRLSFDVVEETREKTTLGSLRTDARVNLERSLSCDGRFEGYFVMGHVDGMGRIIRKVKQKTEELLEVESAQELTRFMVAKGSITVDGISLTLGPVQSKRFIVYLIPHTLQNTTLGSKRIGQRVNIETDVLAKYVVKYRFFGA